MSVLVTGASGFVGTRLTQIWDTKDELIPISIRGTEPLEKVDWGGISSVIHLAGFAHQTEKIPTSRYFEANEHLTVALAQKAKEKGVKSFVFLSTTKVYGDQVDFMNEDTPCHPTDDYGKSKLQAEAGILSLSSSSFHVCIVRSPLIVGSGAKGNLLKLMDLLSGSFPVPLAGIHNKRSMVGLDHLISMLKHLALEPKSGVFLAADSAPISTTELAIEIRNNLNQGSKLFHIPKGIFAINQGLHDRLIKDSLIDNSATNQRLGLRAKKTLKAAIKQMVLAYNSMK